MFIVSQTDPSFKLLLKFLQSKSITSPEIFSTDPQQSPEQIYKISPFFKLIIYTAEMDNRVYKAPFPVFDFPNNYR